MMSWWEHFPGRLEYEIQALENAGYTCKKDDESFKRGPGALRISTTLEGWGAIRLTVRFSYFYPYFPFQVFAEELKLKHHLQPFSKNLCLIGRAPERWYPEWTIAQVLDEMLPKALEAGHTDDADRAKILEQDQAEPFSNYYRYSPGSSVIWDSRWTLPPGISEGSLLIGFHPNKPAEKERRDLNSEHLDRKQRELMALPQNGAVLKVMDDRRELLFEADPRIRQLFSETCQNGWWVRLESPIPEDDPIKFFSALMERRPSLKRRLDVSLKSRYSFTTIIGVVFPEEVARREVADGWLYLRVTLYKKKGQIQYWPLLMRPQRGGLFDLSSRLPFFSLLNQKKVALIGLGCLGAPSALELARSGIGELRIMDHDVVDVGTTVRWPFGFAEAGNDKVDIITSYIGQHYPYTAVVPFHLPLGLDPFEKPENDLQVIERFLEGADLIYDASADLNVNHLLSDLAKERQIPYLAISTTYGAWGGQIVRIVPGKTDGCWSCYRHALANKDIPFAQSDPAGQIQPGGCGTPTYTGASFDAQEIALAGVRLSVSTLTAG